MPKALCEYGLSDWCRLRPATQRWKEWRYRRIDREFLGRPPDGSQPVAELRRLVRDRDVLVTIAFGDAEALAWQLRLVATFIPRALHLVVDNSRDDASSDLVRRAAGSASAPCVRLAPNPWTGRNPSRSHGLALNWIWHHVLLPGRPARFGFLDHDLFPTMPCDPFVLLGDRACGGDKRWADGRWFLWAGYCLFSFARVAPLPLDFGLDWFRGLDTGGANWEPLYRHVPPGSLPDRAIREVAALPGVPLRDACFEWRDDWIHEVGLAGLPALRPAKRRALEQILAPHLAEPLTSAATRPGRCAGSPASSPASRPRGGAPGSAAR